MALIRTIGRGAWAHFLAPLATHQTEQCGTRRPSKRDGGPHNPCYYSYQQKRLE